MTWQICMRRSATRFTAISTKVRSPKLIRLHYVREEVISA
jgi:hypothetical protein